MIKCAQKRKRKESESLILDVDLNEWRRVVSYCFLVDQIVLSSISKCIIHRVIE